MSTTTIRLDQQLEARLAAAAERAGMTAHAFILEAIERSIEQSEIEDAFHRVAEQRWVSLLAGGKSIAWDQASAYVAACARGERPRKPAARPLKR